MENGLKITKPDWKNAIETNFKEFVEKLEAMRIPSEKRCKIL